MALITLQQRFFINNQSSDRNFLLLIQNSYDYIINGVSFGILSNQKLKSWNDLKKYNPNVVKVINKSVNELANAFLHADTNLIQDVSGRNLVAFEKLEAEVYETDISNINGHKLAIYLISKQYKLIRDLGLYILVAEIEDTENTNTLMLELSSNLTIRSYTE